MYNRLQRFFYGRNGPDQLGAATLATGLVLSIVAQFVTFLPVRSLLHILDWCLLVLFFYRLFSRNVYKRREENMKFLAMTGKARAWFRLRGRMVKESGTYKYLKCPACDQPLRVPRGKGKINIRCSKCGVSFIRNV